jgi:hypothetical protein
MQTHTEKCTGESVKITNEQIREAIKKSGVNVAVQTVRTRVTKGMTLEEAASFQALTPRQAAQKGAQASPFRKSYKTLESRN